MWCVADDPLKPCLCVFVPEDRPACSIKGGEKSCICGIFWPNITDKCASVEEMHDSAFFMQGAVLLINSELSSIIIIISSAHSHHGIGIS